MNELVESLSDQITRELSQSTLIRRTRGLILVAMGALAAWGFEVARRLIIDAPSTLWGALTVAFILMAVLIGVAILRDIVVIMEFYQFSKPWIVSPRRKARDRIVILIGIQAVFLVLVTVWFDAFVASDGGSFSPPLAVFALLLAPPALSIFLLLWHNGRWFQRKAHRICKRIPGSWPRHVRKGMGATAVGAARFFDGVGEVARTVALVLYGVWLFVVFLLAFFAGVFSLSVAATSLDGGAVVIVVIVLAGMAWWLLQLDDEGARERGVSLFLLRRDLALNKVNPDQAKAFYQRILAGRDYRPRRVGNAGLDHQPME